MKEVYSSANDYYSYRWDLVGGLKIKADPGSLDRLATYWGNTADSFRDILCDDEEGSGYTARTIRAVVDEYYERVTGFAEQCESNREACRTMRDNLGNARDFAVRAVKKAEEADEMLRASTTGLEALDVESEDYERDKSRLESDSTFAQAQLKAAQFDYDLAVGDFKDAQRLFEAIYVAPSYSSVLDFKENGPLVIDKEIIDYAGEVGAREGRPEYVQSVLAFYHDSLSIRDSRGELEDSKLSDMFFAAAGAVQVGAPAFSANYSKGQLGRATSVALDAVADGQKNKVYGALRAAAKQDYPSIGDLVEKAKEPISRLYDFAKEKVSSTQSSLHTAQSIGGETKSLNSIFSWSGTKTLAKKGGSAVLKTVTRVPFVGTLASAGFSYKDYYDHDVTAQQAGASETERRARAAGAATVDGVAGVAGSAVGTGVGAALGTLLLPGLGTAIGGLAGGVIGGWIASETVDRMGARDKGAEILGERFK